MRYKNVIFDIGNVILQFKYKEVINHFVDNENDFNFLLDNVVNSIEWLKGSLLDTGYIKKDMMIDMICDRTNHINDELITKFIFNYNKYGVIDNRVINLINELKNKGYCIYILSNTNKYMYDYICDNSELFNIVDGACLSYELHQLKPYYSIYKSLVESYKLIPSECIYFDDNQNNIDTGNIIGFKSVKVESDNFDSLINEVNKYNLI